MTRSTSERFARVTESFRDHGQASLAVYSDADLELARHLMTSAPEAEPADPAFRAGLRERLVRSRLTDSDVAFGPLDTPFGPILVAFRGRIIVGAAFARDRGAFERSLEVRFAGRPRAVDAIPANLKKTVTEHLEGRRRTKALDLSRLPDFQRRVLEKALQIPRGQVRPYGWIAKELGEPKAARAVGTALGHNPIPFIVPCHRVVRSDATFGEYSGGGPEVKLRILEWEGVPITALAERARKGQVYAGVTSTRIVCFPTCHAGKRARPDRMVAFHSVEEARASGYRPCKLCRPA
jgi:O-6-methylguanine DNA methyltransferase